MNNDYVNMISDAMGDVLDKHTWTKLRNVLLSDYNGNVIAASAPYPRSVFWHSSSFQTRESGTAVLPGNSEILYQENSAYATNPPPITIGYPEGSAILTVKGVASTLDGLSAQGNQSQPEQQVQAVGNPSAFNFLDLRVDPSDSGGKAVKVHKGAYTRPSAPGVTQYISMDTSVDLTTQISALTGIQQQLALVYLDRETGLFGVATTSAANAALGSVPSTSELDLTSIASTISLAPGQKALGFVYLYSGQLSIPSADIFYDLDPRFAEPVPVYSRTATATTYAILPTDNYVGVTATGSAWTLTLPAANAVPAGKPFVAQDESGGAATHNITVQRAGSDTVNGGTSATISTNYGRLTLYSDGVSKWFAA